MPDAPTPLDLDALAAAEAEAKHYRAQRDEWFLMESGAREAAEAEVILLRTRIRKARHQRDEARAEVARLTARPDPAWDEEVVAEAVATALHGDGCPEDPDEGESCACSDYLREARIAVAVVREHLPVKPGREDMVEAMLGSDIITDDLRAEASAQGSTQREPFLCFADAILDLWPGRSEAEVRADARTAAYREWFVKHAEVSSGYYLIPCVDCAGTGVFPVPAGYEGDSSCVRCKATGAVPLSAVDPKIDDTWAEIKARWQAEALREARDAVRASSFWADGSDNYADRVRGYLSARADRLAAEGGAS